MRLVIHVVCVDVHVMSTVLFGVCRLIPALLVRWRLLPFVHAFVRSMFPIRTVAGASDVAGLNRPGFVQLGAAVSFTNLVSSTVGGYLLRRWRFDVCSLVALSLLRCWRFPRQREGVIFSREWFGLCFGSVGVA